MTENQTCRFKFSSKLYKRSPVFIANFDHSRVKINEENVLKFESFKSDSDCRSMSFDANRTLMSRSDHTEFVGSIPNDSHHFRNFVGVRDKETGKMKLYDSVLFRMKPVIKYIEKEEKGPAKKSYWEGLQDLTQNFGIKSHQRAMSAHLRHGNTSIDEEGFDISDMSLLDTPPVLVSGSQNLDYLPTINRKAETTDKVFSIEEIISPEEDNVLQEKVSELMGDAEKLTRFLSDSCKYVSSLWAKCSQDSEKLKYLVYFNHLITFQHMKTSEIQKKSSSMCIPEPFISRFLESFTSLGRSGKGGKLVRSLSKQVKDKLVASILVLALFIDDFLVNANDLLSNMKLVGLPKLTTISHALGCHVKSQKMDNSTVKFVELKLPLFSLKPKYVKKPSSALKA